MAKSEFDKIKAHLAHLRDELLKVDTSIEQLQAERDNFDYSGGDLVGKLEGVESSLAIRRRVRDALRIKIRDTVEAYQKLEQAELEQQAQAIRREETQAIQAIVKATQELQARLDALAKIEAELRLRRVTPRDVVPTALGKAVRWSLDQKWPMLDLV